MEIRERVTETVVNIQVDACASGPEHAEHPEVFTDQILSITNPPLTRWLPCDKCGGDGGFSKSDEPFESALSKDIVSCTCTNGKAEREIELIKPLPECGTNSANLHTTLRLHDIIDPDVAETYGILCHDEFGNVNFNIPNNKGTLRIKEG